MKVRITDKWLGAGLLAIVLVSTVGCVVPHRRSYDYDHRYDYRRYDRYDWHRDYDRWDRDRYRW